MFIGHLEILFCEVYWGHREKEEEEEKRQEYRDKSFLDPELGGPPRDVKEVEQIV